MSNNNNNNNNNGNRNGNNNPGNEIEKMNQKGQVGQNPNNSGSMPKGANPSQGKPSQGQQGSGQQNKPMQGQQDKSTQQKDGRNIEPMSYKGDNLNEDINQDDRDLPGQNDNDKKHGDKR